MCSLSRHKYEFLFFLLFVEDQRSVPKIARGDLSSLTLHPQNIKDKLVYSAFIKT